MMPCKIKDGVTAQVGLCTCWDSWMLTPFLPGAAHARSCCLTSTQSVIPGVVFWNHQSPWQSDYGTRELCCNHIESCKTFRVSKLPSYLGVKFCTSELPVYTGTTCSIFLDISKITTETSPKRRPEALKQSRFSLIPACLQGLWNWAIQGERHRKADEKMNHRNASSAWFTTWAGRWATDRELRVNILHIGWGRAFVKGTAWGERG